MSTPKESALAGIFVLDLTRVLAGPLCTMMLGDYGADVVKVETPGTGDDLRAWGPPFYGSESAYFLGFNRNKRSLTLNLATPEGREVLGALARQADVVIDNFKTGTMEKWGFGPDWFEAHAPRAVRCSVTGYGATGPKSARPGYDFILQAESGLMSVTGEPDGGATKSGVPIVDLCTGLLAMNAILAALHARARTGRGQAIDVSLHDSALFLLSNVANSALATGRDARRLGNGHPNIVPYTDYPTADGRIAVAVGNDAQFAKFAEVLGHSAWVRDPRFARIRDRVANREAMDAEIAQALQTQPTAHWASRLQAVGVPCGPINTVAQALSDPHTNARDMVRALEHPDAGTVRMLGVPVKMSATPGDIHRAPPRLGEHSDEILRDKLGFTAERIAALRGAGVI